MSSRFNPFAAIAAAVMTSQSGPLVPAAAASGGARRRRRGGGTGTYRNGDATNKRALIAAARELGWKGKSFRTAKKFAKRIRLTEPDTARRLALAFNRYRLGGAR